jgi:hypothetical protein
VRLDITPKQLERAAENDESAELAGLEGTGGKYSGGNNASNPRLLRDRQAMRPSFLSIRMVAGYS